MQIKLVIAASSMLSFTLFLAPLASQETQQKSRDNVISDPFAARLPFATSPNVLESMKRSVDPHLPRRLQSLLIRPEVQQELKIDRNTYSLVSKALAELNEKSMALSRELPRDRKDREAMREFTQKIMAISKETELATQEALNEVFPPESFERLKQIAYQIQIKEVGLGNVVVYGVIADKLEFSDSQLDSIARKAAEFEQEKQAKIREIIKQYDEQLLDSLTSKQRKKYDELVGEPFEYTNIPMEQRSFEQLRMYRERLAQQKQE